MFRYVALTWNVEDSEQCSTARFLSERWPARNKSWGRVEQKIGLCVLHKNFRQGSLDIQALPNEHGVLIGAIFERQSDCTDDSPAERFRPDLPQSELIVASRGSWLIEHTWGNYVAVLKEFSDHSAWVLKDPSGNLPCLRTSFRGVQLIFGNVDDLVATGLFRFTLNERYLRNRVLLGGVLDQDALNEVQTIQRGECVQLDADLRSTQRLFHWHPLSFTEPGNAIEDVSFATRAMRSTVRSCTRTLCIDHESVLLRLSGGLDSSIIAACLADVPARPCVSCYTYYTPGARSDERPWARLAAGRHALNHEEHAVLAEHIPLGKILDLAAQVEPTALMGYLLRSTLEQQIAGEYRATAVFCGDGGDSGFCGETFAYAVSEYMRRHGLHLQALRLAAGVAAITEESTWTVMSKSLRRWRRGPGMEHQRKSLLSMSTLLTEELRHSYSDSATFPHPWFSALQPVPWPLIRRLGSLLAAPEFYNVAPAIDAPEVLAPLYSQPTIELLLRIPVDVHFQDGRERGLARLAFAQDLPFEIARRNWKDRAPGFDDALVEKNRDLLRELLLDGVLVQARLLNRAAVEEILSDRISKSAAYSGELLRHLDVEIWARAWQADAGQRHRVSA
ncbi:asparagine synthase C-terminal domain-containing protein [Steroidobacter sp.]|uniref:asparagine synthase-related protein n=1 Tax=Steroidobacter sp. TaxID=1978227 RepID=UPI001A3F4A0B|nr:asparagine synthase C-terminal domain-containing protein [Steroidobacter sp.]MBL8271544.1 asparagine synthase [Steroidobacter sp.]